MTSQQLMKLILEESEIISEKIKRLEQLSAKIEQSNRNHLEQLKRTDIKVDNSGVNRSIAELERVAEKTVKSIQTTQTGFNWVLYTVVFSAISLAALFFAFKYGFQAKSEIRNEYYNELNKEGRILSEKNAVFMEKFYKWVDKNPNDSKELFREVNKMK